MKNEFTTWLDTFTEEKGINLDSIMEVEGVSGTNFIPVEVLVEAIKGAPAHEQEGIRRMIIKIDFVNGDVLDYFRYLAKAIAI